MLKVKMLAIEGQLYDSELTNPLTLLVGNLDASFVFIFLFPLLIIAFTYNAISEEQENGVWKIVRTTSESTGAAIAGKLLVRLVMILATALVVFTAAVLALQLPLSIPTFELLTVVLLYELFWFVLSVLVIAFGKSSSFNATTLVCIWIFLAILFPGLANIVINNTIPVPEAAETAIRQREGYHAKWDEPKNRPWKSFMRRIRSTANTLFPTTNFPRAGTMRCSFRVIWNPQIHPKAFLTNYHKDRPCPKTSPGSIR